MPIAEHLLPENNSEPAGSIDPAFLFFDKKTLREVDGIAARFLPMSAANRHRLVEEAKSPTRKKATDTLGKIKFSLFQTAPENRAEFVGPLDKFSIGLRTEETKKQREQLEFFQQQECNEVGSKTLIQYREWSDEWRIRTQVDSTVGTAPPSQAGLRISKMLSTGGARKIADSCEFMAKTCGGFKTFVTGTFDEAARARIASGETSIQREVTRALDALSKMYRRGWQMRDGTDVEGSGMALAYCWVVEVPKNEAGEDNPHVHMLFDWQVPYAQFREWSQRIESIWGNGYFHLEKIDDPLCAGAYMAKAAGYLTKAAGQSDQGTVSGNRYAISKAARAPSWSTLGSYQLGIMGMLIREVHDAISARHAEKFSERKRLRDQREVVRTQAKKAQEASDKKIYPLWAKDALTDIGEKLMAVRAEINALPVRASKYQLICKGRDSFERFIVWAAAHGWHWKERPASHWLKRMREKFHARKRMRHAWHSDALAAWIDDKLRRVADAFSLDAWADYERFLSTEEGATPWQ